MTVLHVLFYALVGVYLALRCWRASREAYSRGYKHAWADCSMGWKLKGHGPDCARLPNVPAGTTHDPATCPACQMGVPRPPAKDHHGPICECNACLCPWAVQPRPVKSMPSEYFQPGWDG